MFLAYHHRGSTGSRRSSSRLWIIAFAVVQLVLPGALTVADGWTALNAGPDVVTSHVEEYGHKGCTRVHQEDTCAICQFLAHAVATPARCAAGIAVANERVTDKSRESLERFSVERHSPSLPRAPPLA
ncbi:MAG: hypothetical protein ACHQQP_02660 [Gemmatimonadales bacterium]